MRTFSRGFFAPPTACHAFSTSPSVTGQEITLFSASDAMVFTRISSALSPTGQVSIASTWTLSRSRAVSSFSLKVICAPCASVVSVSLMFFMVLSFHTAARL